MAPAARRGPAPFALSSRILDRHYLFHRRQWLEEAIAIADSEGLLIVADLHSHPGINTREPSESDWDGSPAGWVQGICAVYKGDTGRKRAVVRFWPAVHPVQLRLV